MIDYRISGTFQSVPAEVFHLKELVDPQVRPLSSQSALLHPTEGSNLIRDQTAVDPDHARLNARSITPDTRRITAEQIRCKAILAVIGHRDSFIITIEAHQRHDRAEDLFSSNPHPMRHIGQ